jgi:hypothetical protein
MTTTADTTIRRCRVCGCGDNQACASGCQWVPDPLLRGPLCSACHPPSRGPYGPGYHVLAGVTRFPAVVTAVHFDEDSGRTVAYDVVDDNGAVHAGITATDVVRREILHPDHPDHPVGDHRRTVTDVACTCEYGCEACVGGTDIAVCSEDDEEWPCPVVEAYHAGRASALGPLGERVVEDRAWIGPGMQTPREGVVVAVDGDCGRLEIRLDSGGYAWVRAEWCTVIDRTAERRQAAATMRQVGAAATDAPGRSDVAVGDLVDVPAGADEVCTTRYRIRVVEVRHYGVSGPRVRADGQEMRNRFHQPVERVVPWDVVAKATITKADPT